MKKVLILTASFGEGHNTAARNIRDALELLTEDVAVEVLDLIASTYGVISTILRKTHLQVVQRTPRLWGEIYRWLDSSPSLGRNLGSMTRLQNALADIIQECQPDCVISTYPVYAHAIRAAYKEHAERPFRLITVITDSISVNSAWWAAGSDYFCVANQLTAEVLRKATVADDKIKVSGFPVSPAFAEKEADELPVPRSIEDARVLYIINSGKRKAEKLIDALLGLPLKKLTITVGKDPDLKAKVLAQTMEAGDRVEVLGWTNQMPELMRSHHLIISKAGGATVQEAIAARCPLVVNQIIPGQEEGNAELIEKMGIGTVADDSKSVKAAVERAFADQGTIWSQWAAKLGDMSAPDAAFRIASLALDLAEESDTPQNRHALGAPERRNGKAQTARGSIGRSQRMLLCDLHIHSNYSDGALSVPELIDFYGGLGFDCICITDHLADPGRLMGKLLKLTNFTLSPNQFNEYFDVIERERKRAWRRYNMLVLTGIEFNKDGLTKKSSAHLLGIGLKQPIDPALEITETIQEIHRQCGLAVASHPHIMKSEWGKNTLYLWHNQDIYAPMIDAWEIANRNNIFTPIGLKHLPFIANSDFHKPKHIYSWKTLLHCEKDPLAIKHCIRENKSVAITLFRKQLNDLIPPRGFNEEHEESVLLPAMMPLRMAN
jgi:processive 1,2-diacylglycerol beta-glucosyltransferase